MAVAKPSPLKRRSVAHEVWVTVHHLWQASERWRGIRFSEHERKQLERCR